RCRTGGICGWRTAGRPVVAALWPGSGGRYSVRDQLLAGVTTVRDLGDRRFCVLDRRDRQRSGPVTEPTIVVSGPPLTSKDGHCHYMGGEVSGADEIIGAVAERVERGVDIIKVMASGGVNTPGTDVMLTQFT